MRNPHTRIPELVAACLEHHEVGGMGAVDGFLAEHPQYEVEVRRRLRVLCEAGLFSAPEAVDSFPDRLGPFRLLERIGGGGMGVVYLAEQEPLGRRVAVKLIRPDQLFFERARERFRREIEAIARLKHPSIVPVYSAGEEDGIPYYAMEFVDGRSLDQVIGTLRKVGGPARTGRDLLSAVGGADAEQRTRISEASWVDACFLLVRQLASALRHAHAHGVVHRDLKPSNVMVTPEGRVLLLDFGLASTRSASRMTRPDTQVGSLPYMSPEQLRGRGVDERSDIYSLGVTLYELLSLRLPYGSTDSDVLRRHILAGDARPLRSIERSVPWDAETVCQVAMDLDPGLRYASAESLAADIEAFLDRRPIAARRMGLVLRTRRVLQRRPTLSSVVGLATLSLAIAAVAWTREQGLSQAADQAEALRREAEAEARAGLVRTLAATDELLRSAKHSTLQDHPAGDELVRRLLEDARRIHSELLAGYPEEPEVRRSAAIAWNWEAHRRRIRGDLAGAAEALEQSLPLLEGLLAQGPEDGEVRKALAFARSERGALSGSVGDTQESLAWTQAALELSEAGLDDLVARGASEEELSRARLDVAVGVMNLGVDLVRSRRPWEAVEKFSSSAALLEALVRQERSENALFAQMNVLLNLGGIWSDLGRAEEAARILEETLELCSELAEIDPRPNYEVRAVLALYNLVLARLILEDAEGAIEAAVEGAERAHRYVERYPALVGDLQMYPRALRVLGEALSYEDPEEARATLEEAREVAFRLVAEHPDVRLLREETIHAGALLARWELRFGSPAAAEEIARESLALLDEYLARWSGAALGSPTALECLTPLAEALLLQGGVDEARREVDAALQGEPVPSGYLSEERSLGRAWATRARVAAAQDDAEAVLESCRVLAGIRARPEDVRDAIELLFASHPVGSPLHESAVEVAQLLLRERGAADRPQPLETARVEGRAD